MANMIYVEPLNKIFFTDQLLKLEIFSDTPSSTASIWATFTVFNESQPRLAEYLICGGTTQANARELLKHIFLKLKVGDDVHLT